MKAGCLALILLLAACSAPAPQPPAAIDMIEVASGGMLGQSSTQIFGNDLVVVNRFDFGKAAPPQSRTVHGAYHRAKTVILVEGKLTQRSLHPAAEMCLDYGTDLVRATPPIDGFAQVSTGCPDDAITDLMDHVLSAIAVK